MKCRKEIRRCQNRGVTLPSGSVRWMSWILTERHPACRRREAQPGSCKERENLAGDAKGKGPSGSNCKAESTDAPERGGLLRSVRWAAHESGGLKSLRRSDEGLRDSSGNSARRRRLTTSEQYPVDPLR